MLDIILFPFALNKLVLLLATEIHVSVSLNRYGFVTFMNQEDAMRVIKDVSNTSHDCVMKIDLNYINYISHIC